MSAARIRAGGFVVPADHPCFDGHMPGHPIVPGALLLDRAMAIIAAAHPAVATGGTITIRFTRPVAPDEPVELWCEPSRIGGLAFEGIAGGGRAFSGRIGPRS